MTLPDKKRVLVVHYSQTGQLTDVAKHFSQPLMDHPGFDVTFEEIVPVNAFPFPWSFFRFLDVFPESVYLDPPEIQATKLNGTEDFDLVILAYQVWFLSPSLPTTAFLQSSVAAKLLKGKPVVTLIACRNMWLMAQEDVKGMLVTIGAKLVGNVALVDEAGSVGSFLATPVWLLSGQKGPHLNGLIPKAGVEQKRIEACTRFGQRIIEIMVSGITLDESLLQGLNAVEVNQKLINSEQTAKRGFRIWGKLIRSVGSQGSFLRKPVLILYLIFLVSFIIIFIPLSALLQVLLSPLRRHQSTDQKEYYSRPSGS